MSQDAPRWQSRIIKHGYAAASVLAPHPFNWRLHPEAQRAALSGALDRVGWVQSVVFNTRTKRLLDGHLRVELARLRNELVPVGYVDLDEEEERLVLLTLDPLGSLAEIDAEKLEALLASVDVEDESLATLLDSMRTELPSSVEFKEYDEEVERDVQYLTCPHCGRSSRSDLPRSTRRGMARAPRSTGRRRADLNIALRRGRVSGPSCTRRRTARSASRRRSGSGRSRTSSCSRGSSPTGWRG